MDLNADNLVDAVNTLIEQGYVNTFAVENGELIDVSLDMMLKQDSYTVDSAFKFETAPDSGDASNVYAISVNGGATKGLLIDAFDYIDQLCPDLVQEKLRSAETTTVNENSATAPMRYGLRKIYKAAFDVSPDRYVLRMGFPDFPECPFGQTFSMLGFDQAAQEYVWLVSSIIRDDRLIRVAYNEDLETADDLA